MYDYFFWIKKASILLLVDSPKQFKTQVLQSEVTMSTQTSTLRIAMYLTFNNNRYCLCSTNFWICLWLRLHKQNHYTLYSYFDGKMDIDITNVYNAYRMDYIYYKNCLVHIWRISILWSIKNMDFRMDISVMRTLYIWNCFWMVGKHIPQCTESNTFPASKTKYVL